VVVTQQDKHKAIYDHYLYHLGTDVLGSRALNLSELGWEKRHLHHLDLPFTKEELKDVVMATPMEKASGLDGFIGSFFSSCWEVIKEDLFRAIQQFYHLN
jgi:hypothetical protein